MTLRVTDLSFSYRKGHSELFGGLHHDFASGALTAVTGPSGRGKSTLLYVLGLMLRPTRGTIRLSGRDVGRLPDFERSRLRALSMGFVFQDASLDPTRTIVDSVTEPALYAGRHSETVRRRAIELLEDLGVEGRLDHKPGEISGGQAQRVALARAFICDPDVILADEPTGNLDEANAAAVLTRLHGAAANGKVVIVATHDVRITASADAVLTLGAA